MIPFPWNLVVTNLTLLPATQVADAFAAAFDPPAVKDEDEGVYIVVCSATVPEFTVNIGGVEFTVDPADNLLPLGIQDDEGNDLCASGTFGEDLVSFLGIGAHPLLR